MFPFNFKLHTNMRFGEGISRNIVQYLTELGFKNIGIIIDKAIVNLEITNQVIENLNNASIAFKIYENIVSEPNYDYLDEFKKNFINQRFQALIGIGGGSTLDLSKGIATLLANPGPAIQYRGFPELQNKPLPVIAIPTTSGSGSEVTYNAVFTDAKQKKKLGINSEYNYPVMAIIDPLFTVSCPKSVTISSGADALVHTLESYVHKNHTPFSRILSKGAFQLLFNNLMLILNNLDDINIRSNLALGAYLAGSALINAGPGPSGAFSYPLGAVYKVPHGYAGAVFLAHITRINVEKGYRDYAELFDLIDDVDRNLSFERKNIEFAIKIQELMNTLEIPKSLSFYNLGPTDIEFLIDQYDLLKPVIDSNPMRITKEDVQKMMNTLA
ncbi:MAG: iron-containing alcohol dehydrogenase [bacterium]